MKSTLNLREEIATLDRELRETARAAQARYRPEPDKQASRNEVPWTDPEIEFAKRLWLEGKSAGIISRELKATLGTDRTRVAVGGKMFRLKLLRGSAAKDQGKTFFNRVQTDRLPYPKDRKSPISTSLAATAPPLPRPRSDPAPRNPVGGATLLETPYSACHWPVAERAGEHLFCGEPGVPYCDAHKALAWAGRPARRL